MTARVSLAGYAAKEIQMTEGPMNWVSLKGHNHGEYWLLKTKHFHVDLDSVAKVFTGRIAVDVSGELATAKPSEISLASEDIVARAKPAVVRLQSPDEVGQRFLDNRDGSHRDQCASGARGSVVDGHIGGWTADRRQGGVHGGGQRYCAVESGRRGVSASHSGGDKQSATGRKRDGHRKSGRGDAVQRHEKGL